MKKLLSILLVIMLVATCSACSTSSSNNNDTAVEEKEETPKIEYYPDTNVPTLDSVLGETELRAAEGYYVYGTYTTESEAKEVMDLYLSTLLGAYEFTKINTSVGYQATDGTHTVTIIGGNWESELAVCVMIE